MEKFIQTLDPFYKGVVMILAGSMLLLHTLGFLEKGLGVVLAGFSLYLIIQGMRISGLYTKLQSMLSKP